MRLTNLCVIVKKVLTELSVVKEACGKKRKGLEICGIRLMNIFKSLMISVVVVELLCYLSFRSSNAKKMISSMIISSF